MVLGDLPEARATYILERGMYDQPGDEVIPDVPQEIGVPMEVSSADRLDLAQWLFHAENPLSSRVFVNRIWQMHFGKGLVDTPEDFGAQGSLPSHPELLDYLAVTFRESDWDIKALHRLILTSEAYQRSTVVRPEHEQLDPENRLLSRGPAQRLTAEMMRDNALAISGLLEDQIGGASAYPYQPEGLWDEVSNKIWRYPYLQKPGKGLYRRSLYTIWKRTVAPPAMQLFDAPDRSFCTVQRKETNTPLQALVLLNDPQYVEAMRILAIKIMKAFDDPTDRLIGVYKHIMGRSPDAITLDKCEQFYQREISRFSDGSLNTEQYLSNGELLYDGPNRPEVAALALIAHNLLNTYEAQYKL